MSEDKHKTAPVPGGRMSRLGRMARLAGGIAGGMLAEGGRRLARGEMPRASEMLLTPANARRLTQQLANMRGAAMKLGQLLSMDSGDLLPPQLSEILSRLRAEAQAMPRSQVEGVLAAAWGRDWQRLFAEFSWRPLAAASIGQVHRATTLDGRSLAIKVQYPGVARSIDSDVDNVATLLRLSRLVPPALDIAPLLDEAKRQLHAESDYVQEAAHLRRFGILLADQADDYIVPGVESDLSRRDVLAMTYVSGQSVERLDVAVPQLRNRVAELLFRLLFREMFEFHLVQTDPNFANYRFQEASSRVVLLDFGATRAYPKRIINGYRQLFGGALTGDRKRMLEGARRIGYFAAGITATQREVLLDLFVLATEPLSFAGRYDFAASDLPTRVREAGMVLSMEKGYWHSPPADAVFLHRKLGGLYLLAARLGAQVDLRRMLEQHL